MSASSASRRGWGEQARIWLSLLRRLPAYLRFAPLALRAAQSGASQAEECAGESLTAEEAAWLAGWVRRTPADGLIVQAGALDPAVTCALVAGCWGSQRRVWVVRPAEGAALRAWHTAVIRHGLLAGVVLAAAPPPGAAIDLLFSGTSAAGPLPARTTLYWRGAAQAQPGYGCGRLAAQHTGEAQAE